MRRKVSLIGAAVLTAVILGACSQPKPAAAAASEKETASQTTAAAEPEQGFPEKDVTIIVPYAAGGGVDITTRVMTETAGNSHLNGHSFIVQNVEGGGGAVGQTTVLNTAADGYTILAYTSSVVNNPQLKEVEFTLDDFQALACVCFDPEVVLVPKDSPYQTLDDLLAAAGKEVVNVSTSGAMTSHHIDGVRIQMLTGAQFDYIHCDSASVQREQLLGGHTDAAIFPLGEIRNEIQDGSVRALAIATKERQEEIPDVPTYKECGIDLVDGAFRGFGCRADVPEDVKKVLADELDEICTSDDFIANMEKAGLPYYYLNADDFQAYAAECSTALKDVVEFLNK